MRTFLRVLAVLVAVALVIGIGTAVYNAGVTAGLDEAARVVAASGDPTPVNPGPYGYGWGGPYAHGPWGWGFGGFFGLLFGIFAIFLIIGLFRAAFFGGWRGGRRGPGGPGTGGWGDRRERLEELHREMHRREGTDAGGQAPA